MISDEELHEIAREDEGSDVQFQTSIMAREILDYRKAFSEPFGHMNIFFEGKETGVVWFDHEACRQSDNYIALYRKPTIPE